MYFSFFNFFFDQAKSGLLMTKLATISGFFSPNLPVKTTKTWSAGLMRIGSAPTASFEIIFSVESLLSAIKTRSSSNLVRFKNAPLSPLAFLSNFVRSIHETLFCLPSSSFSVLEKKDGALLSFQFQTI